MHFFKCFFYFCRYFETEETESPVIQFPLGNIKADTEFSFEFRVCERSQNYPENVPFQLVIDFVRPDRQHVMKVFTKAMPVTSSKEEAEKGSEYFININFYL